MGALVPRRVLATWAVLVVATAVSLVIGVERGIGEVLAVVVLAIAMVKIRFVGLDFMELRHAPRWLRLSFEVYCAGLAIALTCVYLIA